MDKRATMREAISGLTRAVTVFPNSNDPNLVTRIALIRAYRLCHRHLVWYASTGRASLGR